MHDWGKTKSKQQCIKYAQILPTNLKSNNAYPVLSNAQAKGGFWWSTIHV